jgi:outer membrane protein assembly factor BamC
MRVLLPSRAATASALLLSALLAACSTFDTNKVDYGAATQNTPLAVPPDLTQLPQDTRYALPGAVVSANSYGAAFQNGAAAASPAQTVAPDFPGFKLDGQGTARWLVVTGKTPEDIWPKLKSFWEELGLKLTQNDPQLGLMETDWAENRAKLPQNFISKILNPISSTGMLDMYHTRLERTAQGTEIYISHRGLEEVYSNKSSADGPHDTTWQPSPSDPEMEVEMLRRLMLKLANPMGASPQAEQASQKIAAAALAAPAAATSHQEQRGDKTVLVVNDPFDRAWRRVGLTLDRTGFTVEDRDRSQGLYYVRYVAPPKLGQEEPGWWARTFGGAKAIDKTPRKYRIVVQADGDGKNSTVTVLNADGVPEKSEQTQSILKVIADDLH